MKKMSNQHGRISQKLLIFIVLLLTSLIAITFIFVKKPSVDAEHGEEGAVTQAAEHDDEIRLTAQQVQEQGIQTAQVSSGKIDQWVSYPARLMANTDQQAHVFSSFSGQVQAVNVELGQSVSKGQTLAVLLVPDVVEQQAQLKIAQSTLQLAQQDLQREGDLWSQGISAKQDYQRAANAYRVAQIQLQAAQTRLSALGVAADSNGRYLLKAPIAGVISQKDLVLGENIQPASALFVIDQLDQLWLEFLLPDINVAQLQPNQTIRFKSLQTHQVYRAKIMHLNAMADQQTGRLQVRAKVLDQAAELRPNLMVNVELQQHAGREVLRVLKSAIQQIDNQNVVFLPHRHADQIEFSPQALQLGQSSSDGQWVEVLDGLKAGQSYVSQGSFLLKSELEKGEATHAH